MRPPFDALFPLTATATERLVCDALFDIGRVQAHPCEANEDLDAPTKSEPTQADRGWP